MIFAIAPVLCMSSALRCRSTEQEERNKNEQRMIQRSTEPSTYPLTAGTRLADLIRSTDNRLQVHDVWPDVSNYTFPRAL